ncbi:LpqB family beta-propeller domain-containing protein [Nocardioides sp.]|uniref:LpqB family beta-propeller domain-containing protein n=1 Tax=Nocardioides sp. TaxID=35761 RepID=UPI002ED9EACD
MTRRRTALLPVLVLTVVAAVVSGCVRLPQNGPVVETRSEGDVSTDTGVSFDPMPPQAGATRAEIVRGFLIAMQKTPISTKVAREFLTADAAAAWNPQQETITYPVSPTPLERRGRVTISLDGANHLDSRGAWQGPLPDRRTEITFGLSLQDGQWRIADLPDALIVPQDWFQQYFRQVSLYFFDPTASILVPEPVFAPRGDQFASAVTRALLLGPSGGLDRVAQTFTPAGLQVAVGVTVSDAGLADILLSGEVGPLTAETIKLMLAQLAWTLRQDPAIESIRLSVGGDPVPLPGGVSSYRVDGGAQYDPAGFQASPLLYGLRRGGLVSGTPSGLTPVDGDLGARELGLRSVGVSLDASEVAGVAGGGTTVLVGGLGSGADTGVRTVVSDGTDFLKPAWDFSGRMWLVDRTGRGARVSYVRDDTVRSLEVPGISGEQVRSFLVSRDGTRLVAVVRRAAGDRLVVSRIQHDGTGRVLGATRARRIGNADSTLPIRAIAWRSPTSVAVLRPAVSTSPASVEIATVDGSPSGQEPSAVSVAGRLIGLAGSPAGDEPVFGLTREGLVEITSADQRVTPIEKGVTELVYAG